MMPLNYPSFPVTFQWGQYNWPICLFVWLTICSCMSWLFAQPSLPFDALCLHFHFIKWVERQSQTTTSATSLAALIAPMLYVQPHRLVGRRCLGSCAPWGSGIPWRNACCSSAKGTGSTFWTGPSFLPQMRCVKSREKKAGKTFETSPDHGWLICS